ncbi:ectonucleoside triphosphate diphosphohydrolase 5 isoform X3 [Sitodiplosis mosellana]|uniref:ectonucleoside triphosphate diphosphohydrolase 5 isoform X3 n=1 Tax=Sitodiplosis mosellana TaxID=263140 RepID=UPI002443B607|nr:ectonucleoside triphosphate diphosphohydrolase 5 isoform X3 [Sitodiplosis mosellana]
MRQYHYRRLSQSGDPSKLKPNGIGKHPKSATRKSGLQTSFVCLIICALLLTFLLGSYTDTFHPLVDKVAVSLGYKQLQYAVVIDAGSTGSRVIAYEFHLGYMDGRLVLDRELFVQVKPGLSFYHDKPAEGAKTIQGLLGKAKDFIPQEFWATTPLVLKATAGLRLLLPVEAENLLNEVRDVFLRSGFLVKDDSVEILDGLDEGIYSWFTINFLLGRLGSKNTVAALDLGGGSTQVTFAPKDVHKTPLLSEYMHTVNVPNAKIDVFTTSYLNLGLQAVRHAVFTHNSTNGGKDLESICVNPIIQSNPFKYGTKVYKLSGQSNSKSTKENPIVDFEACVELVKQKAMHLVNPKPITLNQNQIAAFSYFFERAIETGLVDPFEGGEITVGDFISKSKEICATANTDQPFMCLDLTYISVLLKDGYGLDSKTKVKVSESKFILVLLNHLLEKQNQMKCILIIINFFSLFFNSYTSK